MEQIKTISKRILAVMLSLAMVFSLVQANAFSASAETSGDYEYSVLGDGTVEITKYNGSATELKIPQTLDERTVTSIGDYAFLECDSLMSVEIPNSVNSIGYQAFCYCESLTNVMIGNSVKSIGDYAFAVCYSLTSIVIHDCVESIGNYAFEYCSSLASIEISDSVKSMGKGVLCGCTELTNVKVADGNDNYSSENDVLFNFDKTELIQYPVGKSATSYTIPNTVESIANSAFLGCKSLKSIEIPDCVSNIGESAFRDCDLLTSIEMPKDIKRIGINAFSNSGVYNKDTNWDNGVLYIDNCLIGGEINYNADNYYIKDGTTLIADNAFSHDGRLSVVIIPDSVKYIGKAAFYLSSLKNVTIGISVKDIGEFAFSDCDSLTTVNYVGTKEQWDKIVIGKYNEDLTKAKINYSCAHSTIVKNKKFATYFAKGYSGDTVCRVCKKVIKNGKSIAKKVLKTPKVKVTKGKKQIKVKYTKVSGATGFQVQYKKGKKTITKTYSTKKSVTKSIKKLAKGTYKVKVRALVKSGKNKAYSKWTKTKTLSIK